MKTIASFLGAGLLFLSTTLTADAETLRDAVRYALSSHPALKARSAEMKATAYELMQLKGEFQPTVEVFGDLGRQDVRDASSLSFTESGITKTRSQIGVRVSLVIFDGYRRANRVYAEAARLDSSIFALLDASETMALNATEAYIDVYRHRALLKIARRNIATHIQIGRQVRDLVEAGRLPLSDELTINDRIGAAQLAELEIQRAVRDAITRYERVVGRSPSGEMGLSRPELPRSTDELIQTAISNSYRVKRMQAQMDQVRANGDSVLASRSPRVAFEVGATAGENRNGSFGNREDAYLGLTLNWTIYKGGRKDERNALAQRNYAAAFERDTAVRDVRDMAELAWTSLNTNTELHRMLQLRLSVNQALVEVYGEEFEAAKRTLLDLLEVERARFNVEFEKGSAEASMAFSQYRVLAAQSRLAAHFGVAPSDIALEPGFQSKARSKRNSVFNIAIEPLE